jgi:aspartate carbamoyltransferase regulatory subunit
MKQIKVNAIKHGTVIDHIAEGKVLKVIEILDLHSNDVVMIGMNLPSNKIGKKDIMKIENRELSHDEVNSIALIAPNATLIIIQDFNVVEKQKLQLPEFIDDLIVCPNPKCITGSEEIKSKFRVVNEDSIKVRCHYCEKKYLVDEVKIKI